MAISTTGFVAIPSQTEGWRWISIRAAAGVALFAGIRLAFGIFVLTTSLYCLLVYVPFTYFSFIRNPLLGWLPPFVRFHALIYAFLLAPIAFTLIPELRTERKRAAVAFLLLNGAGCSYLLWRPVLGSLSPDLSSYFWSILAWFPLLCLGALDLAGVAAETDWAAVERRGAIDRHEIDLAKTTLAALLVSVAFGVAAVARAAFQGRPMLASFSWRGLGASLCFHLVIFNAFGLVLKLIQLAARRTPWPRRFNFVLTRTFAVVLCFCVLRSMVLPTISFEGIEADIFAATVALAGVVYATGFAVRVRTRLGRERLRIRSAWRRAWLWGPFIALVFAAACGIPAWIGRSDWDFVLQKSAVLCLWVLVLQFLCWLGLERRGKAASLTVLLLLIGGAIGTAGCAGLVLYNPAPSAVWSDAFEDYAGLDVSFKTAWSILSRSVDDKAYSDFYAYLRQRTNLGREVIVRPPDVRLVDDLKPSAGRKPNIFLFVIDSLRQDYVSPYNSAIDCTPMIGHFAQDSVVFRNAFTRYGGTALSEPAIWVGAMQLHKQYIEPFSPMNNLQKLLDTDGYQSFISVDPILREILHPSSSIVELENDKTTWGELDFVTTLKRLESSIDARPDANKPIFAYSQPQNVHTLTLERSRMKGGRKEISLYELRRMDAAFGEFVSFLKQRGLYDDSIIILTADHGDSYGEFGRYGHSDFLFPEVIRIPLIMHLPPRMREELVWDTNQLAFTTDITPSLYYLLGHRPIVKNELFGRPLFTRTTQEQSEYMRSQYVIVSSYAPVYAILGGNGQSLFIVDAVNSKNYFYNLAKDPLGTHNHATARLRNENEALIRHEVDSIDEFYGWRPLQNGR